MLQNLNPVFAKIFRRNPLNLNELTKINLQIVFDSQIIIRRTCVVRLRLRY